MNDSSTISLHNEFPQEQTENQRYPYSSQAQLSSAEVGDDRSKDEQEKHPNNTFHRSGWDNIPGEEIGDNDVILGRGIGKSHHGNLKFRSLVRQYKMRYLAAPRAQKPRVSVELVRYWRSLKPPGRFLARKENDKNGSFKDEHIRKEMWYDVGDKRAREKASMSLREKTSEFIPLVNMFREHKEKTSNLRLYHVPGQPGHEEPKRNDWFRGWGDSFSHDQAQDNRLCYVVPPPTPRISFSTSHPSQRIDHILFPAPGWKDYSSGRTSKHEVGDPVLTTQDHSSSAPFSEHAVSRNPQSFLEVQQEWKIRRLSTHLDEQRKLIASLQSKLEVATSGGQQTSDNQTEVTPHSNIEYNDDLFGGSVNAQGGGTVILSPVPYNAESNEENEAVLHGMLFDCFDENTQTNKNKMEISNAYDKESESEDILLVSPVRSKFVADKKKNKPMSENEQESRSFVSSAKDWVSSYLHQKKGCIKTSCRSILLERNNCGQIDKVPDSTFKKGAEEGTFSFQRPGEKSFDVGGTNSLFRHRGPLLMPRPNDGSQQVLPTRGIKRKNSGTPVDKSNRSPVKGSPLQETMAV